MPRRVAVVEDDAAARAALVGLVEAFGYEARGFPAPADILAPDALDGVACLILDMRLPDVSGLTVHERLRARGIFLPTLLVTAYPDDATRARALKAGIDSYLAKPVAPEDLLACLRRFVP